MLHRKELTLTLDDFRTIFYLPQATNNNHDHFVPVLKISEMVPYYINNLGFTLELRSTSNFKTTGLLQPWQTLCKMFLRCLTTRVTGYDQPSLQIMQMLYSEVFGVDVPTTQSQPIESTQGTHRTTSTPRTPNPEIAEGELSAPQSHEELETTQNVEKVKEHLMAEEIEKLVEGTKNVEENVEVASLPLRNDDNQTNPDTRLEPRKEEESAEDDYKLKRREKGKEIDESRNTPSPTTTRSLRTHSTLISSDTEKLQELTETNTIPSSSTASLSSSKLSATNRLLSLFKSKSGRFKRYKSFFN
ncbi:hypothetical protein Tco_1055665 [Tanacetum coccineum]|uniref:Uncharacterized protein n=1 Tax=Tanacetum coccineum TaxID=301880 RepID=A0ABQ5H2M2_9ASTR